MALYLEEIEVPRPQYLGGGNWKLKRLNEITIIFGKNGSGKSLLLRKLRDQDGDSHHYVCPERAGDIQFNPTLTREEATGSNRASRIKTNFVPDYRNRVIARIQAYLAKRGSQRSEEIGVGPNELEELLNPLLPNFVFEISGDAQPYELKRNDGSQVSNVQQLSSGEAEAFVIAIDLLTICAIWELEKRSKRVLLIDEPDPHLHPDLQQRLADFIVRISEKYKVQVLVATHSTTLLSALGHYGGERTSVIYLNNAGEDQVAIKFDAALRELATCLGGHALMGPLFGVPLLLVEGIDDYNIWSQVPRHHNLQLAVIPCNGEEIYRYQKTLEKILACILELPSQPCGFALVDGDKKVPQPSPDNPQRYIRFLKLACHESENLYLSDEVLATLGFTWEEAKEKIKLESHKYGQKASILKAVDDWDRKTQDLKGIINEISWILDEKHLPWTLRIGKLLGKERPTGQLREFLGDEVVIALWGQDSPAQS